MKSNGEGIRTLGKDKDFKGILTGIEEYVKTDRRGKQRVCWDFTIKRWFTTRVYTYQGSSGVDFSEYFEIGERVIHHRGCAIPEKMHRGHGFPYICVECGEIVPDGRRQCVYCGKVL